MNIYLVLNSTNCSDFTKLASDSAKFPVFGAQLNNTLFQIFVRGIKNSLEHQKKSGKVSISEKKLFSTYCGIHYHFTNYNVWPHNSILRLNFEPEFEFFAIP